MKNRHHDLHDVNSLQQFPWTLWIAGPGEIVPGAAGDFWIQRNQVQRDQEWHDPNEVPGGLHQGVSQALPLCTILWQKRVKGSCFGWNARQERNVRPCLHLPAAQKQQSVGQAERIHTGTILGPKQVRWCYLQICSPVWLNCHILVILPKHNWHPVQ